MCACITRKVLLSTLAVDVGIFSAAREIFACQATTLLKAAMDSLELTLDDLSTSRDTPSAHNHGPFERLSRHTIVDGGRSSWLSS